MTQYSDNDHKFTAVLNKKIDVSRLLNALGHMSAGVTSAHSDPAAMRFLEYADADGGSHPAISHYPFIVLSARNGNQIRTLRQAAAAEGITYVDFVDTMIGSSATDQMDRTRQTKELALEYFGIVLFGAADKIDPLTRKFSLFTS